MSDIDPRSLLPLTHLSYQVLLALADDNRHGYGIIKEVYARTDGEIDLETGTLYTALRRLKDEGLIDIVAPDERPEGEDDRRRVYRLTPIGTEVLRAESRRLIALVGVAMEKRVLPEAPV
jgi:DNA-binding PadR family transcriptional regulator